jgi:hypothetical protein
MAIVMMEMMTMILICDVMIMIVSTRVTYIEVVKHILWLWWQSILLLFSSTLLLFRVQDILNLPQVKVKYWLFYLSFFLCIHPKLFIYHLFFMNLSINQSIYQSMDMKIIHLPIYLSIHTHTHQSIYLHIYLFIHLSTYSSIYVSINLFIYFYNVLIEADAAMKLDGKELLGRNVRLDWTD